MRPVQSAGSGCIEPGTVLGFTSMNAKKTGSKKKRGDLSAEHKAALAEGRAQGRAIRRYLEAIEAHRPKRGRKRTPDSIRRRLQKLEAEMTYADPLRHLQLVQERMDLQTELDQLETTVDLSALEKGFVAAARGYSERKGISYAAWREVGIPAAVLKEAGISRGR